MRKISPRRIRLGSALLGIVLGEFLAIIFWSAPLEELRIPSLIGTSLCVLLSCLVIRKGVLWPPVVLILAICSGFQVELGQLVRPAALDRITACCGGKFTACEIETELRIDSSPQFTGQGAINVRAKVIGGDLNGLLTELKIPDEPWRKLSLRVGSVIKGRLKVIRESFHDRMSSILPDADIRRGIALRGRLSEGINVSAPEANSLTDTRLALVEQLTEDLGYSRELAVVLASSIGYAESLDEDTIDLFKRSSLYHVLIVSGSHVSFVFLAVRVLLNFIASRSYLLLTVGKIRRAGTLLAFVATYYFVQFSGAAVPSVRGLYALAIYSVAELMLRSAQRFDVFVIVAAALLLVFPGAFLEIGPILTFSAIIGIFTGIELVRKQSHSLQGKLRCLALVSFVVWLFTAPWIAIWFGTIHPLSFIFNVIFGPLLSAVVCVGGLLGISGYYLGLPGSQLVLRIIIGVTGYVVWMVSASYSAISLVGLGEVRLEESGRVLTVCALFILNILLLARIANKGNRPGYPVINSTKGPGNLDG